MKTTAKYAAAAMIAMLSDFYNTANSTLHAQVLKAMEKAKTIHAVGVPFSGWADGQGQRDMV
jgi:hypothetical protein